MDKIFFKRMENNKWSRLQKLCEAVQIVFKRVYSNCNSKSMLKVLYGNLSAVNHR